MESHQKAWHDNEGKQRTLLTRGDHLAAFSGPRSKAAPDPFTRSRPKALILTSSACPTHGLKISRCSQAVEVSSCSFTNWCKIVCCMQGTGCKACQPHNAAYQPEDVQQRGPDTDTIRELQ